MEPDRSRHATVPATAQSYSALICASSSNIVGRVQVKCQAIWPAHLHTSQSTPAHLGPHGVCEIESQVCSVQVFQNGLGRPGSREKKDRLLGRSPVGKQLRAGATTALLQATLHARHCESKHCFRLHISLFCTPSVFLFQY